jgi:MYXO-CTERM domain-containing protein
MRARTLALVGALAMAAPSTADAFCGFYISGAGAEMFNNATQVVLMRHGTTTVLSMQNNYQGPPEAFALVVPVPVVLREENVKTLPRELFAKVDVLGAPRLVEYWETDPCAPDYYDDVLYETSAVSDSSDDEESEGGGGDDYKVTIEAQFTVGEYDIVILSAKEATGLDRWLRDNKYQIPDGTEPLLRPYIEAGSKFFVAKVDPKKVTFQDGMATLSPLRFHYDHDEFSLPIRLGLANSSGTQDLIVNILAPSTRYEVANFPNTTIPTNIGVKDEVRNRFGEFYAALFDHTLEQVPGAVVTEYSWDSSSCDPCPGPVLEPDDLATLGADVIASTYRDVNPYGMVLTRLHARYGTDVKDDLVFRAVAAIEGGRGTPDAQGKLDPTVRTDHGVNNFQARYVIRHPWTGTVACDNPVRGRWGGPPPSEQIATGTQAATDLAFAPRGDLALTEMVADDVPEIGVLASEGNRLTPPVRSARGCGCTTGAGSSSAVLLVLVVGGLLRRRRR